jgi:hypothetical protein
METLFIVDFLLIKGILPLDILLIILQTSFLILKKVLLFLINLLVFIFI